MFEFKVTYMGLSVAHLYMLCDYNMAEEINCYLLVAVLGECDATMEAQNNNQPTLDNHNNLYKIPGQEDQVRTLIYSICYAAIFETLTN